jgi:5-methylcytosine-specific restriction endonuclease McrA
MAITKRLRFEILRRDDFACRYCGGKAPDIELTVDHVTPKALGGTDEPTNNVWRYFCGICWRTLDQAQQRAKGPQ